MNAREHLHEFIDTLPDSELEPAARFLEFLRFRLGDPVLRALERAPLDDEPITAEDAQALEEAFSDRDHGWVLFISYTLADQPWAEWIAWQVEESGYKAILQAWHFGPGSNFVQEMHRALQDADRVIAVISLAYEKSAFGAAEWEAVFSHDPTGEARKLIPVRVEDYKPAGLLAPIVYIDLADIEEEDAARERLLEGLRGPGKPKHAPSFPRSRPKPLFPGGGLGERPRPAYWNDGLFGQAPETVVVSRFKREYTGEPINMSLKNADLVETLRAFASISGLNFVIQPGVSGSVTLELKSVPWDQAMVLILKVNNMGMTIEGNIVRIAPVEQLLAEERRERKIATVRRRD